MQFVVAYDIRKDSRRVKVMSALKDHGLRVQYSVFECELDAERLTALKERLAKLIDPRRDKVSIYALCQTCYFRSERLGAEESVCENTGVRGKSRK